MKQIMTIFRFTFADGVRKKAFLISTAIILILILVGCLIPKGVSFFQGNPENDRQEESLQQCWYIDESQLIPEGVKQLKKAHPEIRFTAGNQKDIAQYKEKVGKDSDYALILVEKKGTLPHITVISKDFMSGPDAAGISEVLSKAFGTSVLKEKGYNTEDIAIAQVQLPYDVESAGDMNISSYMISIVLTLLIFFAIYYYGYGVAMSIATEKASRVMETLVVSAKPSRILIGKCLGMGVLGLLQFAAILLFGGICYKLFIQDGTMLMGAPLDLSGVNGSGFIILLIYFILGYALYAVMNSVCGALVNKIEDLNSAMMPVMLLALASFFVSYMAAILPNSDTLSQIAVYVPFTAPFIMPHKILNEQIGNMELLLSMGIMIAAIVIVTLVSIRIYSASVLHYGGRQKLLKLYKERL